MIKRDQDSKPTTLGRLRTKFRQLQVSLNGGIAMFSRLVQGRDILPNSAGMLSLSWQLLKEQGRLHIRGYTLAFIFMAVSAVATSLTAWLMRDVINKVFIDKSITTMWLVSGAVVLAYATKGLAGYGQDVTLAKVGNRIVASIQERMFQHLLSKDVAYFAGRHSTEFIAQQSFMANSARNALNMMVTVVGRDLLTLIGLIAVMLIQDPLMSIGAFVFMPFAFLGVRKLVKRSKKIMLHEFASNSVIMETVQETAQGIRVVKSFNLNTFMLERMRQAIRAFETASTRLAGVSARSSPIMETLGGFTVAVVILYGGWRVIHEGQTPGAFFSFITAFLLAYEPAKRLAKFNVDLSAALVGVRMMFEFLRSASTEPTIDLRPDLVVSAGKVKLKNVTFHYRDNINVLQDFDFVAEAGKSTALIGPSGSGKSTIFSLLQGFYRVQEGIIEIDDQDISCVNLTSLRQAIAVVSQDAFLFKGSIRQNIRYGRLDASDEEIVAAARAAHAHEFIEKLDGSYDAHVGEHGNALSGGQRQRIAIARAILKNAPIILLDEATSALDLESEQSVQAGLRNLARGRTLILIAHRRESYAHADRVVHIEKGNILKFEICEH
ncbi:ABC transporter ATP-binding protein [Labrys sp. 22185]|uniref:ABC transporter ATP-binding protein n=1 Tax=Labrys sp. 22185 TaxID=3453888 RepID=UPI003F82A61F